MEKAIMGMMIAVVMMLVMVQVVQAIQPVAPPEEPAEPELPPTGKTNLYGVVTDKETGGALEGVLVTLNSYSGTTDVEGHYEIVDVEPGSYALKFEKEGYGPATVNVTLPEGNVRIDASLVGEVEAAPPFTFSNLSVQRVRCETATAWNTLNFWCTITNPASRRITHTLTPMFRVGTKSGLSDPIARPEYAIVLAIDPGESRNYYLAGNQADRCTINIGFSAGVPYGGCAFLRDENGNDSPEACV